MSEDLARQFVEAYFETLQKNRNDLINFYTDNSILSNEGNHYKGLKEIAERIESYSFQTITHEIISMDAHPSPIPDAILILLTGKMQMDQDAPFKFVQNFHLLPNGSGGYFVANDIFRLIMHDLTVPGSSN